MPPPAELERDATATWRQGLDPMRLPRHVAVIMDGNGRWAARHHLPRAAGHQAGVKAVRSTVETCARLDIPALTLYAFSTENWERPEAEVSFLMALLRRYLRAEVANLKRQGIRLDAIGRLTQLPAEVQAELHEARTATASGAGMRLTLALNYGARAELADACQAIVDEARGRGAAVVTDATIARHLYTAGLPELDLLIRTSGEMRVSNFLLWQLAYAEIVVTPVLWPEFDREELVKALLEYQRRDRRFGGLRPTDVAEGR